LQAIVDDRGAKSILHMRFVRDGFEESRINFPSITKYPLKANEENTIFSCLHSTNLPIIANTELRLTLKDMEGRTVHTYTYAGDITGDMMGLKDSFVPSEDLSSFTLTATLLHNGKLIDEVTQTYDCEVIDSKNCAKKSEIVINNASHSIARELYIGGVCVSILVAIKLYMLIRRKRLMQVSE
jgi:hypothetical protein